MKVIPFANVIIGNNSEEKTKRVTLSLIKKTIKVQHEAHAPNGLTTCTRLHYF